MSESDDSKLENRLLKIAEERERLDREQESLRSDAEAELRRIDPQIEKIKEEISEKQREVDALKQSKAQIEEFLQRLNTRSHPLRRAAVA